MMAVDTKQGGTTTPAGPAATLAGMPAVSASGAFKRKRPSSLMAQSASLPSVENSLDEFIAKANETLIDPSTFNADQKAREEDEKRKEHDALRWKATEQQMVQAQAREEALRRQLAGLQGQLAEAEARAAVAGSGGSQDGIIADLRLRLTMADEKVRTSEEKLRLTQAKVEKLEQEVVAAQDAKFKAEKDAKDAKASAAAAPAVRDSLVGIGDDEAEQRVRLAEAKAAKAIAAAKAASAGLTVSAADIAAIESGLVVTESLGPKKSPIGAMIAALLVGGAVAFAIAFVMFNKKGEAKTAASAQPAAAEHAAAPQAAEKAKPTVTPIDEPTPTEKAPAENTANAAAPTGEEPAAKAEEPAAKAEEPKVDAKKAAAEAAAAAKAEKAAAAEAAAAAKAEKAAAAKAAAQEAAAKKAAAKKTTTTTAKKKSSGDLSDPFGDAPAPKKAPAKKKDSGLVDPF
jgi:hypothetical protein